MQWFETTCRGPAAEAHSGTRAHAARRPASTAPVHHPAGQRRHAGRRLHRRQRRPARIRLAVAALPAPLPAVRLHRRLAIDGRMAAAGRAMATTAASFPASSTAVARPIPLDAPSRRPRPRAARRSCRAPPAAGAAAHGLPAARASRVLPAGGRRVPRRRLPARRGTATGTIIRRRPLPLARHDGSARPDAALQGACRQAPGASSRRARRSAWRLRATSVSLLVSERYAVSRPASR